MPNTLYLPELREMLATNNTAELQEFCTALHPARTADFMEGLTGEEAWAVLEHADMPVRVAIFNYFERDRQLEILGLIPRDQVGQFIAELPPDDRVDLLKHFDPALVEQILPLVPANERRDILRLRAYPENTAGSMMTTEFARIAEGLSVREALDEIGRQASNLETIYYIYVVDDQDHLRGVVTARQLVTALARPETPVGDLMEQAIVSVRVMDDREDVAQAVAKYDLLAIPVVDQEYHLIGIITHDDIIDAVVEEANEDAYRMAAVAPMAEGEGYLDTPFLTLWSKRAGWLSLLFVAELFTFTALAHFEDAIGQILALSLFVPLCISTGGNSGSQAATLLTRAIALGQVTPRDWIRVVVHELLMGLALGVTLGAIGFVRASLTPQSVLGTADRWALAFVIAQAVAFICLWGTLTGSMLPLLFKRLGIDPGFASSPFVATFVDVTGIIIYFSIAKVYLL